MQRSAKKGIVIKEKDVNLLKPDDSAQENNSSSDEAADEVDENEFSIKLKQGKAVQFAEEPAAEEFKVEDNSSFDKDQTPVSPQKSPNSSLSRKGTSSSNIRHNFSSMALRGTTLKESQQALKPVLNQQSEKSKRSKSRDTTVIHDIVKRKRITFLKSSHLFSQEETLFGPKKPSESPRKEEVSIKVKNRTMI